MSDRDSAEAIEKFGKILIIDDEPTLLVQMQEILGFHKIEVVIAETVQKGFETLESASFDLVMCDIRIPGMSGIQFLESIRHKGNSTPLVFFSGFYETDMLKQAMQLGAFDFIEKPISEKKLMEVIEGATEYGVLQRKIIQAKQVDEPKNKKIIKDCEQRMKSLMPRRYSAMTPHREEQT